MRYLGRCRRGFSLLELLIALTIFSIVAVGLYAALSAGIRLWDRGESRMREQQERRVFFAALSRDLRNAVNFSEAMPFKGRSSAVSFMTLADELVRVEYALDPASGRLTRTVAGRDDGFDTSFAKAAESLETPESLELGYAFKSEDSPESTIDWLAEWNDTQTIPRGVRIRLGPTDRVVLIPSGTWGKLSEEK